MADCDHNCESCGVEGCGERQIEKAKMCEGSSAKKVIGILSGKGGVGKSFVTSALAVSLAREGYKVGILDADVTGPSIPKAFGVKGPLYGNGKNILPVESNTGIKIVSSNLMLDNESEPIVWRGVLLSSLVKQFYEEVYWGELDYLLIDMPPGTGDISLTVFQSIPLDELIIVTSPQDLVSLIVSKALGMAKLMDIKVLGVIENMSYVLCPDCGKKINVFGDSKLDEFAKEMEFDVLAKLPIVSDNTKLIDEGRAELVYIPELDPVIDKLLEK